MKYEDYYKQQLEKGEEFQDYVADHLYSYGLGILSFSSKKYQLLYGENKAGIEIKYDTKFPDTGNIYIETAEKSNPSNLNYSPSGIYRPDNSWLYIIGNYEIFYIFSKTMLKLIEPNYKIVQIPTSKGFLLPLQDANKYAAKIIEKDNLP